MRSLIGCVLFIIGIGAGLNGKTGAEFLRPEQSPPPAIWMLRNTVGGFGGTGFFVSESEFITNYHVIQSLLAMGGLNDISSFQMRSDGSIKQTAAWKIQKISALSVSLDLALLKVEGAAQIEDFSPLAIRETPVTMEEDLFVPAFPDKRFYEMKKKGPLRWLFDRQAFHVNHADLYGASGAPVWDERGEVVGVGYASSSNLLFSIPAHLLKDFIKGKRGINCDTFDDSRECLDEAVLFLTEEADRGYAVTEHLISRIYFYFFGNGMARDEKKAMNLLESAGEQGYISALYELAIDLLEGEVIEPDTERGIALLETAAQENFTPAQYELSFHLLEGKIIEPDTERAVTLLETAARENFTPAQYSLGRALLEGKIIERNTERGIALLETAARENYTPAQYILGRALLEGKIIERNVKRGLALLKTAARENYTPAQ